MTSAASDLLQTNHRAYQVSTDSLRIRTGTPPPRRANLIRYNSEINRTTIMAPPNQPSDGRPPWDDIPSFAGRRFPKRGILVPLKTLGEAREQFTEVHAYVTRAPNRITNNVVE